MTINEALRLVANKFKSKKITSAFIDAEVLLSLVLKKPKEFLYTYPEKKLSAKQIRKLHLLTNRRLGGEPLAYLTGHKEFYGLNFYVDKRVLIPRPETELLIDEVINYCSAIKMPTIADIGTGSGCIAISLAKKLPLAKIYASDISQPALQVAKINAKKNQVKINFINTDLLSALKQIKIDVIVANLPYLTSGHKKQLDSIDQKTLKYEPVRALAGGANGLKIYDRLFTQINQYFPKDLGQPKIFCEISPTQVTSLKKLLKKNFLAQPFLIKKDLCGLNRIVVIN